MFDFAADDKQLVKLTDLSVDEVIYEEENLEFLCRFMIEYSFHAAPRKHTLTFLKNGKVDAYCEDKSEEIKNNFKWDAEYLSRSDIAWTIWQFINAHPDFVLKKDRRVDKKAKHVCKTKFTSDGVNRFQPDEDSEGMQLYHKIMEFVKKLMKHREWTWNICQRCNVFAKKGLLLIWTE